MDGLCDVSPRAQTFYFILGRAIIACKLGTEGEAMSGGDVAFEESALLAISQEHATAMLGVKFLYLASGCLAVVCLQAMIR